MERSKYDKKGRAMEAQIKGMYLLFGKDVFNKLQYEEVRHFDKNRIKLNQIQLHNLN